MGGVHEGRLVIFDTTEGESDDVINGVTIHCVWIRHEKRDHTGSTPLHYTLAASRDGRSTALNFRANCPECRQHALQQAEEMLRG